MKGELAVKNEGLTIDFGEAESVQRPFQIQIIEQQTDPICGYEVKSQLRTVKKTANQKPRHCKAKHEGQSPYDRSNDLFRIKENVAEYAKGSRDDKQGWIEPASMATNCAKIRVYHVACRHAVPATYSAATAASPWISVRISDAAFGMFVPGP